MDFTGIGAIVKTVGGIADDLITTDEERREADQKDYALETERMGVENAAAEKQIDVNIAEAKHRSMFVAGWRPGIGWVCVAALAYHFLIFPLLSWIAAMTTVTAPPDLETGPLFALVTAMLGMGGLRTFEKHTGKARKQMEE